MALVSKTLEVGAHADAILSIVADFEAYPQWNSEVTAVYILARYNDGRPSQLRIDTEIQGQPGTYIQAVYYPAPAQIQTVMQQGQLFSKQNQLFSVVEMGPSSLLTVDLDVETSIPGVPDLMVKKLVNDALDHLAGNLKARAEALAGGA
jgi:ribosome-associated toxin RatA of RatAB toxin-antitoxin module